MNNQNILTYYGSKLDIKIDGSEYYDYELGKNSLDYNTDVLNLNSQINYTDWKWENTQSPSNYPFRCLIDSVQEPNYIKRRPENGWTIEMVFNIPTGKTWNDGNVFYYWGISNETNENNYADNNLSFRFNNDRTITWNTIRYRGVCNLESWEHIFYKDSDTTPPICDSPNFLLSVVFERYSQLSDCDLDNSGGINDLISEKILLNGELNVMTGGTPEYSYPIVLNEKWVSERSRRLGTLKMYHNGKLFYKINDWEEVIPTYRGQQPIIQTFGGGTTGSGDIHETDTEFEILYSTYFEQPLDFSHVNHRYLSYIKPNYSISECNECSDTITKLNSQI
jgi:hypothetical protein